MQRHHISTPLALLVCIASIGGCSSLGESFSGNRQTITIRSEPPQATVLADGAEIGATPLTFKPGDAFRAGITTEGDGILAYRYIGKLTVKKPGCKDYVTEVNDNILSKDIDVKLECDPDYRPPAPQPAASPGAAPTPAVQPTMPASAAERLQRIEALHDKGLITDTEHRELRQRVLDTL
jgi:hypothetical protein